MVENIKEHQIICYVLHYVPSQLQLIPTDMYITTLFIDNGNLKYVCVYIYIYIYIYINTTTQ